MIAMAMEEETVEKGPKCLQQFKHTDKKKPKVNKKVSK
jgi:hypothetical protein